MITDLYPIIHNTNQADFTAYTYTGIYFSVGGTATVNGVGVQGAQGTILPVLIQSATGGTATIQLLGEVKPHDTGNNSFDIKTGKIIII